MARNRKEPKVKLKQPDRSGPSNQTLLDIAEKHGLLKDNNGSTDPVPGDGEILVGRVGEAILWSISLTMVHFTFDVLVANQYAVALDWPDLFKRQVQAFPIIQALVYFFHPHAEPPVLLPRLPAKVATILQQLLFLCGAVSAGSYLIHITNNYSYYAVLKQAPPMGILWIWSVIELDLPWAVLSLLLCSGFLKYGGYSIT